MASINYRWRVKPEPNLALCVVLARLAYPDRSYHLCDPFGRSLAWLSTVFNDAIEHIAQQVFTTLMQWHPILDSYEELRNYADVIEEKDLGYQIWGFIDGTFQGIGRPQTVDQRDFYSGYYGAWGFKWQAIVTPDGLILSRY